MASPPPPGGGPAALFNSYLKICSDIGCQPMPELVEALRTGQRACFISSPTESLPDGTVISLCAVLPMSPFESCSFHNLNLSTNSWAAIADACSKTRPLQHLLFKDCGFRDGQGLAVFSRALSGADLESLEICNCQLSDDFVAGLTDGSLLGNEKFATLRMSGCGLGDAAAVRLAKAIEGVGMMCSLRHLDLSHNRIGDPGACALAAMLGGEASPSSVPIVTLELEDNQITDVGGLALCRAAKAALMLQRLNLSLNPALTSSTMVALADAVRFHSGTLAEVALAGCRAGEDAAVALLRAANKNNTLQLLDIRGIPLGAEGVAQLCSLLRYTTSLNTLRVDVASAEGAEAIARDLPSNRSLMHITLGGPVPDGLLNAMSEILAANTVRRINGSPAASSPLIHAWIEDSTIAYQHQNATASGGASPSGNSYRGAGGYFTSYYQNHMQTSVSAGSPTRIQNQYLQMRSRPSSPSPPPAEFVRSPRSDAGGSVYSHATHRTARTHRTHRTSTSYLSFGGLTDMSRRTIMVGTTRLRVSASLAAGGAAEKAAVIFRKHDQNEDNHLNKQEMLAALEEMGVLNGIKAKHVGRFLDSEFKKADWDKDGRVSLQDFISYYEKIAYYQAQMAREGRIKSMTNLNKQMVPQGTEHNAHLKRVFKNYARLAIGQGRVYADGLPQMNSAQFHRLCQDAGFMEPDGRLSTTAVDVIFTRYRAANSRRMAFKDFIAALAAVAYEMGFQFDDIMEALGARNQQPLAPADAVRETLSEPGGIQYMHPHGQQQQTSTQGGADPGLDVLGVPLATVHEGAEGKKTAAAKGKATKKVSGPGARTSTGGRSTGTAGGRANGQATFVNNNPLYDSQEFGAPGAAGPFHSSFNVTGAINREGHNTPRLRASPGYLSPRQNVPAGTQPGGPPASDLAIMEARLRLEMEAMARQLEERIATAAPRSAAGAVPTASGAPNGPSSGGLPASADALVGAKLRQLEGQVSGLAPQLSSLQEVVHKMAEEVLRIKSRADTAASTAASAIAAASAATAAAGSSGGANPAVEERLSSVTAQMGGLQDTVNALRREMQTMSSRLDTVTSQVSACRASQSDQHQTQADLINQLRQQHAAQQEQLRQQQAAQQEQLQQLAAVVAALPADAAKGAVAGVAPVQMEAMEKKLFSRLSRYDGALLQVAKQVDLLDMRLREESEGNMKTIEMLFKAAPTLSLAQLASSGSVDVGLTSTHADARA
ncbi:hypothetical protein PLESTB_000863700 [Pleodorina starrii]|uniref:EF-hand domain-containing protein n=1 Tax=Pleodorina starrii TaxID=330485 RepID=A0A9W6BLY3_9CHLO|nr:hypothetical protein PLESTM_001430300 [Pleodorina starrii]GLC54438.1 hypothetical protein PLESTB_000863700 [Pleodorina starrii]GLC72093.1 hypothetical protein PLESTF_001203100 [Pleodorina starrii]